MALVQMATEQEAIKALAKFHNITPEGIKTKNDAGLCFSFSGRKAASNDARNSEKEGKKKEDLEETPEKETEMDEETNE